MKKREFLNYINSFRGFAMLLIVAVHIIYLITDSAPREYEFLRVSLANSSILFIFISGYLFQYLIDDYTYTTYLKKKFSNVIMPYIIMSVPAILLLLIRPDWRDTSWIMTESFQHKPVILQVMLLYITGSHQAQFWFIPMIAIFYLVSPLFLQLDKHPRFYLLVPGLIVIALIVDRPSLNNNSLQSFVYFLPVYLLGMHASHYRQEYMDILRKYWVFLLIIAISLSVVAFYREEVTYLQKISVTYLILLLFSVIKSRRFDSALGLVAQYSFGIFFIHKYVIIFVTILFAKLQIADIMHSGTIGLIFTFLLVITLSILFLWPVKLVFRRHSRLICGC